MKIIGITGNSGSGKSTIAKIIKDECGGIVIDADRIAKDMTNTNSRYLQKIINAFGTDIIKDHQLDRKKMADIIFNDKMQKEKLDKITFKYVVDEIKMQVDLAKEKYNYIILDVPLLFESRLNEICNYTVGVVSEREDKINRICKRDNISRAKAEERINSQPDDSFYIDKCDFIINNLKPEEITDEVHKMMKKLQ